MRLPHRRRDGLQPRTVKVARAAIAVAVDVLDPVPLPQQQQRHALPLQLLVHLVPIGLCPGRCGLKRRRREQAPIKLGVVHPFRHRQVMPTTPARRRYSATVDRLTPTDTSICRSLRPSACFNLRASQIFRIGALSAGIGLTSCIAAKEPACRDSCADTESVRTTARGWPIGTGGRLRQCLRSGLVPPCLRLRHGGCGIRAQQP
jgi:hypothetical protein